MIFDKIDICDDVIESHWSIFVYTQILRRLPVFLGSISFVFLLLFVAADDDDDAVITFYFNLEFHLAIIIKTIMILYIIRRRKIASSQSCIVMYNIYILLRRQSDHDFALLRSFWKKRSGSHTLLNSTRTQAQPQNEWKKAKRLRIDICLL